MSSIVQPQPDAQYLQLNSLSLADAALSYAALGIRIFPLQPNSKLPMQGWSWKKMATTDADTIRQWWSLWPSANIGAATGVDSGVDALDIDMKHGQDGRRSYQAIAQEEYIGPVQQTPTGGTHLLFTHEPGLINFTRKGEFGGLDMRTTGGYIVVSPSITAEGAYHWAHSGSVPVMPDPLLLVCKQWSSQSSTQTTEAPDIPEDLPDISDLNLPRKYTDYLIDGDTSAWNDDESIAVFATAGALMRKLNDPGLVFGIMADNAFVWACAERHRQFGDPGAWLWKYGIAKMVEQAGTAPLSDVFNTLPMPQQQQQAAQPDTPPPAWITWGDDGVTKATFAPDWIVRGLIERGQVGLVYGDSQALKSYLCLDLAAQVTLGGKWHGHDVVSPGKVLFIAGEGNVILWRRLEALRQARGIHSDQLKDLGITGSGINLMDRDHLAFLKQQLDSMDAAPELIIVDTLSRNAILDENSARDIGELVNTCDKIAKAYNSTVILVHHTGKQNKGNARGSYALEANTDFRFKMERLEGGAAIRTKMDVQKLKGAPEPEDPIVFEAKVHTLIGVLDDELVPVSDLVLERVDKEVLREHVTTKIKQAKLSAANSHLLGVCTDFIMSRRTITHPDAGAHREELYLAFIQAGTLDGAEVRRSNFNRGLNKLTSLQWLRSEEDDFGQVWYNIPKVKEAQ